MIKTLYPQLATASLISFRSQPGSCTDLLLQHNVLSAASCMCIRCHLSRQIVQGFLVSVDICMQIWFHILPCSMVIFSGQMKIINDGWYSTGATAYVYHSMSNRFVHLLACLAIQCNRLYNCHLQVWKSKVLRLQCNYCSSCNRMYYSQHHGMR